MDLEQATEVLPQLLDVNFDSVHRVGGNPTPGMQDVGGWIIDPADAYCYTRVARGGPGMIWSQIGVSLGHPVSNELGFAVAVANRNFTIGRAYLAAGEELAMVVVEDISLLPSLSLEHPESLTDVASRIMTAIGHAKGFRADILSRFGGQRFSGDDWRYFLMG